MSTLVFIVALVCFLLLLGASAFFSAAETLFLSLSPVQIQRIRDKSPHAGARLVRLLDHPDIMLSTILVGNTFANVMIASIGYSLIRVCTFIPDAYQEITAMVLMTGIVLLFGEISPKQLALRRTEAWAPTFSLIVSALERPFSPITFLLRKLLKPFKQKFSPESRAVTDKELLSVVNLGQERGTFDPEERAMVHGILRLSELNASDVMTPRVDLIGLDLNDPPARWLETLRSTPFDFLPVWRDTPDNIIDFVSTSAFLLDPLHDLERALCRKSVAVPENIGLDDLIITFYRQHLKHVVVTDEYGGTAGIVSRGDILELLSLDTDDDTAQEAPDIWQLTPNRWIINGRTSLEQINFELGTHLEADDADRISGWVTFHAGHIPRPGETVEADGYRVTVKKMRKRTIQTIVLDDLNPRSRDTELHFDENGLNPSTDTAEEGNE